MIVGEWGVGKPYFRLKADVGMKHLTAIFLQSADRKYVCHFSDYPRLSEQSSGWKVKLGQHQSAVYRFLLNFLFFEMFILKIQVVLRTRLKATKF